MNSNKYFEKEPMKMKQDNQLLEDQQLLLQSICRVKHELKWEFQ